MKDYKIERIENPTTFYEANGSELAAIGADAFGQPVEVFAPQVEERFNRAEFAHAMYALGDDGDKLVGFGLYDMLRGQHWQLAFYRG